MAEQTCENDVPLSNHTPYREGIVVGEEETAAAARRFYVLELHGDMLSPCVRRVVIVLRYHHIPFTFVEVDMSKGEHKSPSFVGLNPNQDVPVLVEVCTLQAACVLYHRCKPYCCSPAVAVFNDVGIGLPSTQKTFLGYTFASSKLDDSFVLWERWVGA